jgi:amino acid transporter
VIALLLSRVAAGFGGFMAGTGLVHGVVAANPWGFVIGIAGVALLIYGIRQAAHLAGESRRKRP